MAWVSERERGHLHRRATPAYPPNRSGTEARVPRLATRVFRGESMRSIETGLEGWGVWILIGGFALIMLFLIVSPFFMHEAGPRRHLSMRLPLIIGPLRTLCQACGVTYLDDADHVKLAFMNGKCPDCGSTAFYEGPSGGLCTNIRCAGCSHWFNHCGFFVERIARTDSTPDQGSRPNPPTPPVQAPRLLGRRITLPPRRQ